jgi:HEAT repeat protein
MPTYLLIMVGVIGTSIGVVLLIMLVTHLKRYWQQEKLSFRRQNWEQTLAAYLQGGMSLKEASQKVGTEYYLLWSVLDPHIKEGTELELEKIKLLAAEIGMKDFLLKKLKQGNGREKIRAAVILGKLGEESALPYLKELLTADRPAAVIAASRAIAEIGETSLVFNVVQALFTKTHITFEGMSQVLTDFGSGICPQLADWLRRWLAGEENLAEEFEASVHQPLSLFIDLIGYNNYFKARDLLADMLNKVNNEEVLIHIFKTLARFKKSITVDLTPYLTHDNWVIRSQTAKFIGVSSTAGYVEKLVERLGEESWWVRFHSGQGLFRLGKEGMLEKLAQADDTRSEMSRYILDMKKTSS